ncbi:MAG: hypothetical protein JW787_16190 [Sedimentisphaerales bacterium]|nr:hypothetical protein [Sedimentisphaerales bacterium]
MTTINYKSQKKIPIVALIVTVIFIAPTGNAAKPNLDTQAEVSEYINILTGFDNLEGTDKTYKMIDVTDDNTPFLHERIKGKKNVWLVEVKNVRLKLKSAIPSHKDRYTRKFDILVDPNTGNLLKITSKYEGYDPDMLPEPNAINAENQLKKFGEMYLDFPNVPPKISFLDALNVVHQGLGDPYLAKEINGLYVIDLRFNMTARPVWIITLRGLPPLEPM